MYKRQVLNVSTADFIQAHNLINITMQDFYDNTAPQYHELLRQALFYSLNNIYYILVGSSVLCLILSYFCLLYTSPLAAPLTIIKLNLANSSAIFSAICFP